MTTKQMTIARRSRLKRVENMLLKGVTNQDQMAARLGVTQSTLANDIKWVREQWKIQGVKNVKAKRLLRIRQYERLLREAWDGFEKSRQDEVETTTRYEKKTCDYCGGAGSVKDEFCETCNGEGKVDVEVVTQKISGSPGDVAWLNSAKNIIKEIVVLEGITPDKPEVKVQVNNLITNNTNYENIPREKLHEALQLFHNLDTEIIEAKVVDNDGNQAS